MRDVNCVTPDDMDGVTIKLQNGRYSAITSDTFTSIKIGGSPKITQYYAEATLPAYTGSAAKSWSLLPQVNNVTIDFSKITRISVMATRIKSDTSANDVYEFPAFNKNRVAASMANTDGWYLHDSRGIVINAILNSPLHNILRGGFTLTVVIDYKV